MVIADTESEYPYSPTGKSHLPDDCDIPDPLELLSFVAGATTTLGLSTGVLVLPNHNPVVHAKRLATLDRLSGGRLRICLGLGWMKEEIEACGGDFERRGKVADEAIAVMRSLWRARKRSISTAITSRSRVHTAGRSRTANPEFRSTSVDTVSAAARRAGRLGDGFQPLGLAGEDLDKAVAAMKAAAVKADRDPADVSLVLGATLPGSTKRNSSGHAAWEPIESCCPPVVVARRWN